MPVRTVPNSMWTAFQSAKLGEEFDTLMAPLAEGVRQATAPLQIPEIAMPTSLPSRESLTASWVDPGEAVRQQEPAQEQESSGWGLDSFESLTRAWVDPPKTAPQQTPTTTGAAPGDVNLDGSPVVQRPASAPTQSGDLRAYTRAKAVSLGIDPDIADRVVMSEGGFDDPVRQSDVVNAQGERERSFGPFQMYMNGGLGNSALKQGIDVTNPDHVYRGIDYALEVASKSGWGNWHGAARVGIGNMQGIGVGPGGPAPTAPTAPPATPSGKPVAMPQGTAGQRQPLEGITPEQFGLGDADAEAICGPVLAMAFARANGRNPTIAEAKEMARKNGGWTSAQGMGGPEAMARTLRSMDIPATYRPGALDIDTIRRETQNGNPVGINTRGHYFVVEGVDDQGRLNLGNSAKALKASGGRQWFSPDEIAGLGMGAPTGAIYKDNPASPTPSVAAPKTAAASPPAAAASSPAAPAGASPPAGAPAGGMTVRDQWGNEFTMTQEQIDKRPGGSKDLTVVGPAPVAMSAPAAPWVNEPAADTAPLAMKQPLGDGGFNAAMTAAGATPELLPGDGGMAAVSSTLSSTPVEQPFNPDDGPREALTGSVGASPVGPVLGPPIEEAGSVVPNPQRIDPSYAPTPDAVGNPVYGPPVSEAGPVAPPVRPAGRSDIETVPQGVELPAATQALVNDVPALATPSGMKPVWDALGNVVGYVQETAAKAAEIAAPVVQPVVDAGRATGDALTSIGLEPFGGAPRMAARINEIHTRAAADQGRTDIRAQLDAGDDPTWRAANPEMANELDDLSTQFALTTSGQAGDSGVVRQVGNAASRALGTGARAVASDVAPAVERALPAAERAVVTDAAPAAARVADEVIPPLQQVERQAVMPGVDDLIPPLQRGVFSEAPAGFVPNRVATAAQHAARRAAEAPEPLSATEWTRKLAATVGYSSMIGPSTFAVNVAGNLAEPLWAAPKEIARAVQRGAPREALEMAFGAGRGLMDTGNALVEALAARGRYAPNPDSPLLSQQTVNPIARVLVQGLEAGGRVWSGVPDAIFGTIALSAGEARRAAQIATDAGLKGAEWKAAVQKMLDEVEVVKKGGLGASPEEVDDIIKAGQAYADHQTFRDDLGKVGEGAKAWSGGNIPVLGNLLTPFWKTPWNMGLRLGERTPILGTAMNSQRGFDKAYDQIAGSALFAGMLGLASQGKVTGGGPADIDKRKEMESLGWQRKSVLVNIPGMGEHYVPNRVFGVFGPLLDAVGETYDAMEYRKPGEGGADAVGELPKRYGNILKDQPYLQGISDILSMIEGEGVGGKITRYGSSLATRMVPYASTARTIGTALDEKERTTDRGKTTPLPEQFQQQVASGVGTRSDLPIAQNVLGQDVENPRQGIGALWPKSGKEKDAPTIRAFMDANVDIGPPKDKITVDSIPFDLNPREQRMWNTARGEVLQRFAANMTQKPWWSNPTAREAAMKDLLAQANEAADQRMLKNIGAAEIRRRVLESRDKQKAAKAS